MLPFAGFLPSAFFVITYLSPVDVLLPSFQGIKIFHICLDGHLYISRRTFFLCSSIASFAFDFQIPRRNNRRKFYSIKLLAASPFLIMVTLLTSFFAQSDSRH
jgi:hypothetical protein